MIRIDSPRSFKRWPYSSGTVLLAVTLAGLSLDVGNRAVAAESSDRPNLVFILADDQGWNGLSVRMLDTEQGSKSDFYHTPNLEKLASAGMRFSNAYAPAPVCSPTRCSILTGKSPAKTHMTTVAAGPLGSSGSENRPVIPPNHLQHIPTEETTLAEMLRAAGYATAHFGKWHVGQIGPGEHGFDEHDGLTGNADGNVTDPNPKDIFGITDRASAFMEKNAAAKRPFYVQLSHYAVHGPAYALEETRATYETSPVGERHTDVTLGAMTENLDSGVGMILEKIEQLGIARTTYVIYMSDNGAPAKTSPNTPLASGKGTLWEGGIRSPLIVRGPGIEPGTCCDEPVVGYDLFPTLCELAGVGRPLPDGVEGGSLVGLLRHRGIGHVERPHEELVFHFPHYGRNPESLPRSALRLGDYKLIRHYETGKVSLFNLSKDISESNDLADRMPEKVAELTRRLDRYLADVDAQMPVDNPDFDPSQPLVQAPAGRRRPGPAARAELLLGGSQPSGETPWYLMTDE